MTTEERLEKLERQLFRANRRKRGNIVFKQVPYEIKVN